MPSFCISSLSERQLAKLRQRQDRVRQEIDGYTLFAEALAGQETANVFRAYMDIPCGLRMAGRLAAFVARTLLENFSNTLAGA